MAGSGGGPVMDEGSLPLTVPEAMGRVLTRAPVWRVIRASLKAWEGCHFRGQHWGNLLDATTRPRWEGLGLAGHRVEERQWSGPGELLLMHLQWWELIASRQTPLL